MHVELLCCEPGLHLTSKGVRCAHHLGSTGTGCRPKSCSEGCLSTAYRFPRAHVHGIGLGAVDAVASRVAGFPFDVP